MTVAYLVLVGVLYAVGTYLILQRLLSRVVIGLGLLAHGANLVIMLSGRRGSPPLTSDGVDPIAFADPLPQSLVLTAIVITFGVTALLLALAYRSWKLTGSDAVEDDREDRRIAARGEQPL